MPALDLEHPGGGCLVQAVGGEAIHGVGRDGRHATAPQDFYDLGNLVHGGVLGCGFAFIDHKIL